MSKRKRVPILLYHIIGDPPHGSRTEESYVSVRRFDSQMKFLSKRGYTTVYPDSLERYYRYGEELPEKSILITFDDGSRSVLEKAVPVMKKYGFSALIFLVSDYIGKDTVWDKNPPGRKDHLLQLSEIKTLSGLGFFFGSHTKNHAKLLELNKEEAYEEISGSKTKLENLLDQKVDFFAYPWGEYNTELENVVREAGYSSAFTAHQDELSMFSLRRQNVGRSTSFLRFFRKFYTYKSKEIVFDCEESVLK